MALFERYGFRQGAEKITANGTELVLVRNLYDEYVDVVSSYPIVRLIDEQVFLLSLQPKWHTRLLPDSILQTENSSIVGDLSHTNSIHKVYLSAMRGMERIKRGDLLLIYRTSDGLGPACFRSVATSICVIEEYRTLQSFVSQEDFLRYCRPYSVFTLNELKIFWAQKRYPHIIRFTYNIALPKRVTRGTMIEEVGFDDGPNSYWGFMPLSKEQFMQIAKLGKIDESLIVH